MRKKMARRVSIAMAGQGQLRGQCDGAARASERRKKKFFVSKLLALAAGWNLSPLEKRAPPQVKIKLASLERETNDDDPKKTTRKAKRRNTFSQKKGGLARFFFLS